MKSEQPILYVLGVPGQFYLAQTLSQEFGRPVFGITSLARIENHITEDVRNIFQDIRSLPGFYFENKKSLEAMSTEDFNALFQSFEKKLGITNNAMLVHYDRALRWIPDHKKVRVFQLAVMQFVDQLLSDIKPAFVLDGVASYLQHVLRAGCRKKNIPYLLTQNSRLNGHFNMLHEDGQHVGMQETFKELEKGNIDFIGTETAKAADEAFESFINKPARPAYAERNAIVKFNPVKALNNLKETLKSDRLFPDEKVAAFDRALGYEFSSAFYLKNGLLGKYRRLEQNVQRVFEQEPDLDQPFIYLPLHFSPEVSDMYFGAAYDHHAGFVAQLAKQIPANCMLYVKEHTSMLGRRPTAFYKELNALYNVKVIAPSVSTFDLTKNAAAVATVTGTAGWEGFLLGKPVIVLGNVFYNFLPGVYNAPLDENFGPDLQTYLDNFKPDEETRRTGYRAFYATCCKGTKGDIGREIQKEQAVENASLFARSIRTHLEAWGKTIPGRLPKNMTKN